MITAEEFSLMQLIIFMSFIAAVWLFAIYKGTSMTNFGDTSDILFCSANFFTLLGICLGSYEVFRSFILTLCITMISLLYFCFICKNLLKK